MALDIHPRPQDPIVILGGSRVWEERELIWGHLTQCDPLMVVTAQTRGAVDVAGDWCSEMGVAHIMLPAPQKAYPSFAPQLTNLRLVNMAGQLAEINNTPLIAYLYLWGDSPTTRHLQTVLTEHGIPTTVTEKPVATPVA